MEEIYECPKCGEKENLHLNYDYSKQHRPVESVLCNECGEIFDGDVMVDELLTKPGFVERRMTLGQHNNNKLWDEIYNEYSNDQYPPFGGPFTNALSFIDWLKINYIAPERIKK